MNIVFISPYPPLKDGLAGYTKQLVLQMRLDGHDVGVIASSPSSSQIDVGMSPRKLLGVCRYLQKRRPDVVHVQYTIPAFGLTAFPMWALLWLMRCKLGFRLVITFHEVKRETMLLGKAGAMYMRLAASVADHITVHTKEAVSLLQSRCYVPRNKISYITHPLYIYKQAAGGMQDFRRKHNLVGKRVVLFFGYIHIDKGVDHLISAFAQAKKADKNLDDAVLVVAGSVRARDPGLFKLFEKKDHDYEAKLHTMVDELGIASSVRFVPYVPDADVAGLFKLAHCVVLPYTNLEQSGVLNIALGSMTPIIASNLGGLGETLAGTQALVPAANDAALAKKIGTFFSADDAVRKSVTGSYKTIVAVRTVPVIVSELVKVYQAKAAAKVTHG
jgi:glycosyltransferase involved in cell wall biosynthesis